MTESPATTEQSSIDSIVNAVLAKMMGDVVLMTRRHDGTPESAQRIVSRITDIIDNPDQYIEG